MKAKRTVLKNLVFSRALDEAGSVLYADPSTGAHVMFLQSWVRSITDETEKDRGTKQYPRQIKLTLEFEE